MSKIIFRMSDRKKDGADKEESAAATEKEGLKPEKKSAQAKSSENKQASAADDAIKGETAAADDVQMALFPGDEPSSSHGADGGLDRAKQIKYFKRHPKKAVAGKVERYAPKLNKGLSAEQVDDRFKHFLFNDTNKQYSRSYASIFIGNICTFFNLLCVIAGIALILANTKGISNYLVILITTANIVIGIIQEIRSKRSIDKLAILASNTVKVIRDGETVEIPVKEIVLDDVILLDTGNQVPADCILAEGSVEVNESLLTGESVAIKKNVGDTLYAGSFISSGSGKMRVDKVGKDTYLEKLTSKAKKYKRPNSELMNSTKLIIKFVSILIIPVAIGTFIIALHNTGADPDFAKVEPWIFTQQTNYAIQRTCTVVIGMIPSGMLLLTSLALAMGILRMARSQTLVQDMYSLEMLARVNVLCLDKTGTITDGRMRVNDAVILNTVGEWSLNDIMGSMLAALDDNNQTSIALTNHFGHSDALTAVAKIPFSSKRKLSAVTFDEAGTFVMGAPEFVLKPYPAKVEKIVRQYAQMGLRVIVVAHSPSAIVADKLPSLLKPVAIISIADNIREDAIQTINWFKQNDVAVKVISGDNPVTVAEVAKRAGIANADKFISLDGLNDKEVENVANKYTVFGRVSPEQKAILVRSIKAEGNTVAMTGDGVNDILALKEADCAISVASGSEAARNVSHLVLMDNNFNSLPKVVAEGRRVINNIKNSSSLYLMKTLFTAILAIICIAMSRPYLFMPSNMLLLEIAIIAVPSFFLSLQPNRERVQGKFITYVLSGAAAGAVTMIICVMSMYATYHINHYIYGLHDFDDYYKAMCILALTFSGFVMVYRICKPFNVYRAVLCVGVMSVCIACFCVPLIADMLLDGWSEINWQYPQILIVLVVLEAAFPISNWLLATMHTIFPSARAHKDRRDEPAAPPWSQSV